MQAFRSYLTLENLILLLLLISVAVSRVVISMNGEISGWSNFTPLGAMALYGGAYFKKYKSFAFPLLILWISDIFMNRFVFYGEWRLFYEQFYWTYGAFALMVLIGKYMLNKVNVKNFAFSTLTIVFIHWIVTDLGVWLEGMMYPKTIYGLGLCLAAAIPYELNLLVGTVIYGSIMFGAIQWISNKLTVKRLAKERIIN